MIHLRLVDILTFYAVINQCRERPTTLLYNRQYLRGKNSGRDVIQDSTRITGTCSLLFICYKHFFTCKIAQLLSSLLLVSYKHGHQHVAQLLVMIIISVAPLTPVTQCSELQEMAEFWRAVAVGKHPTDLSNRNMYPVHFPFSPHFYIGSCYNSKIFYSRITTEENNH